ncbi:hypothetical protein [Absidia glauca]|uniref:Anaphase-promoting complex subunit 4 WD40 domain-containing protein n=1 Tax=Absidia glauca TaxID=4829 RepID=A0A163JVK0_ABSGL|nr:hypothetical protein [Absidia glauca]
MSATLSQCLWQRRCNKYNTSRSTLSNKFSRQVYGDPFFLNRMVLDESLQSPMNDIVTSLCWSGEGDYLLSGSCSGQLYLWNTFDSTQRRTINSSTGSSESGPIWLCDLESGHSIATYPCSKASTRLEMNGSDEVLSCSEDGIIRQFDLREQHRCDPESECRASMILDYRQHTTIKGDPVRLQSISIDPFAPHYFAVAGSQNYAYLHDRRMQHTSSLVKLFVNKNGTAFSGTSQNELCYGNICKFSSTESGSLLVNWSDDDIYLFNIYDDGMSVTATSQGDESDTTFNVVQHRRRYTGHLNPWVNDECVGFYGLDEEYIISGTDDGMIFLWNRANEKVVQMLTVDRSPITGIKAHPTLPLLAITGSSSMIKLYTPRSAPSLTSPSTHPFSESSYATTSHMYEADILINRNERLKHGNPSHLFNHLIRNDSDPPPCYIQ